MLSILQRELGFQVKNEVFFFFAKNPEIFAEKTKLAQAWIFVKIDGSSEIFDFWNLWMEIFCEKQKLRRVISEVFLSVDAGLSAAITGFLGANYRTSNFLALF